MSWVLRCERDPLAYVELHPIAKNRQYGGGLPYRQLFDPPTVVHESAELPNSLLLPFP